MIKRELIRIGACAVVGLIFGIIVSVRSSAWHYALIGPFYGIGTFYGIKIILAALGGLGKTAGKSVFTSIAGGHWFGLLIIIILFLITTVLVLTFGWVIGMFVAVKETFGARKIDAEIGGAPGGSYDTDWGDGSSSGRSRKKRKSVRNDEYDDMSW